MHRFLIQQEGLRYSVHRSENEKKSEFLTSTEVWFRPVHLAIGPDDALYVVDMYREIIEDYSGIQKYLAQRYGLIAGDDRGRIWRISYEGQSGNQIFTGGWDLFSLTSRSTVQLVGLLSHTNAWWRQPAQRLPRPIR